MANQTKPSNLGTACEAVPIAEMSRLFEAGYSLIPLGKGSDGKEPLVTFQGRKRLPFQSVIRIMQKAGSAMYGIRLGGIVVVDCDTDNVQTLDFASAGFGHSDFMVKTSRGRHLYFHGENTQPEKIAIDRVKIDLKTGPNAYVVGPGSVRPDNGAVYTLASDWLPSPNLLPAFADRRDNPLRHHPELVPVGGRNDFLFSLARQLVERQDSRESLFAALSAELHSGSERAESFPESGIWKIVDWVWKKRLTNNLWGGKKSAVQIYMTDIQDLSPLPHGGNALTLFATLKHNFDRAEPKPFPIDRRAMVEGNVINGWTEWTYRAAISTLLKAQKIIRVRKGGIHRGTKGQVASLFMFNNVCLIQIKGGGYLVTYGRNPAQLERQSNDADRPCSDFSRPSGIGRAGVGRLARHTYFHAEKLRSNKCPRN